MSVTLSFLAAALAAVVGSAAVIRKRTALASWSFFAVMLLLGGQCLIDGWLAGVDSAEAALAGGSASLLLRSVAPLFWLGFSLVYCRGNRREFLHRWRFVLIASILIPVGLSAGFHGSLLDSSSTLRLPAGWQIGLMPAGKGLALVLLLLDLLILVNLEKTFRAAVGLVRWRVKYLFLGIGLIFGAEIYQLSQILVFSALAPSPALVHAAAVVAGCGFMGIAYARKGFGDIELYPSRLVLEGSITVLLAGLYLVGVGLFARWVRPSGAGDGFPAQALVVLAGFGGLGVVLLSDRVRTGLRGFVSRHFSRPRHDYRAVWAEFSRRLSGVRERDELCRLAGGLVSETFEALNVSLYLTDDPARGFFRCPAGGEPVLIAGDREMVEFVRAGASPFDLETERAPWAAGLREKLTMQFEHGGHRIVAPLVAGEYLLGFMVLADRVEGTPYTQEELELLKCLAGQLAGTLLNDKLATELRQATELEAFQTMSSFFVHDLKNAANSLNLMLQNLPVHYDDPEFRKDALRGIGSTVDRINHLVAKLAAFRRNLRVEPVETNLNHLVAEAIEQLRADLAGVELSRLERELPAVKIDREGIRSVVTNLLSNARDATGCEGRVRVETAVENGHVMLSVSDNGCGMTPDYIANDLFRPFRSTKSKGLGIGMFQCRMIVEAHRGNIAVDSKPGEGTTFRISLPHSNRPLGRP